MKNLKLNKKLLSIVLAGGIMISPVLANADVKVITFGAKDTLYGICQKYYGNGSYWKHLAAWNNIENQYNVPTGREIGIPDLESLLRWAEGESPDDYMGKLLSNTPNKSTKKGTYKVKKGDTLESIAKKYYGDESYASILGAWNNFDNGEDFKSGITMNVPDFNQMMNWYIGEQGCDENGYYDFEYTCKYGDTLWAIASKYYNSGTYYKYIIEYNEEVYNNTLNPKKITKGTIVYLPNKEVLDSYKVQKTK